MLRILLFLVVLLIHISCSKNSCDYEDITKSYDDLKDFQNVPIEGTYKLSDLSTDNSFSSTELLNSNLYFISDSTHDNGLNGQFLFRNYPAWQNESSQNKLENFYGNWIIVTQPGGIFGSDRLLMSPFYDADFEKVSPKSMIGSLDVRLMNGQPVIIVRVFKNLDMTSAKFGYSLVYPTSKSKNYCNYLAFVKESVVVNDSVKTQIISYLNSEN